MTLTLVSSCFDVEIDEDDPLRPAVDEALQTIDGIHGITSRLPKIPLEIEYGMMDDGVYRRTRNGAPVKIALADDASRPVQTLVHEVGHYLDHQAIDTPGQYASETSDKLDAWRDALIDSAAIRGLLELSLVPPVPKDHPAADEAASVMKTEINRLLRAPEAFARSYTQYITLVSRNDRLTQELGEVRAFTYLFSGKTRTSCPSRQR
jgi:hypothetical protein